MRKKTKKIDIIIIAVILLLIVGGILLALLPKNEQEGESSVLAGLTLSDFNGKRAGITTGSIHDTIIKNHLPDSELYEFNNYSDMTAALISDRIDYFLMTKEAIDQLMAENSAIGYIDEPLDHLFVGALFPKTSDGDRIREQFDGFITDIKADGTLESIYEYWRSSEADGMSVDMSGLTGENGKLIFATNGVKPPVSYVSNGNIAGTDPDIAVRFCRKYGYDIEVVVVDTAGIIPGLVSGMFDFAMSDIVITEERKESINFSVPYNTVELYITARKADITGGHGETGAVPAVTLDELNSPERTVGVWTGTSGMLAVEKYLPDAKELMFENLATAIEAVRAGQTDAFVFERRQLQIAVDNGISGVMLLDDNLGEPIDVAVGLSRVTKISGLENSINLFIAEKKADGTLDEMFERWVVDNNYTMPEISPADSPEFTLVVGTSGLVEPYSFYKDNELTGFDIEMARRFAAWLGADIEFRVTDYTGLIAAAQSGSIDCIFANLNVTDERKEAIDFSDKIYSVEDGIMVAAVSVQNTGSEQSWLDGIVSSFEKNFIRENRWQLILDGIGTTCLITVLSALFGSVLAFLICMFRRTGSRLANAISNIYVKLLQGTPIVVLLMILYYVILGKSGLEAVWVAIIGFTLNFGAYASEIMRSGIESIDGGQREAALALGYNENQAFFRFIFPQAAVRFLPVYNGEIVSLLKSTSIVGYIAIQDLTKMSDIIRSRTYEAFFPLIATAIIYFILAWIISLILKFILKKVSPKRKRGAAK